jgi:H+/Na+-translocating ferredoxin:NAD+ oxidoreductase subunit B
MDITFKKDKAKLNEDVIGKSIDLQENLEDFRPRIDKCSLKQRFITISPECVRCNLCVEECPVYAISEAKANKPAKILDNCVKCDICAETCPIRCIHVIESTTDVDEDVAYHLKELEIPHRTLKMRKIEVNPNSCKSCGTCVKFCPTGAISLIEGGTAVIDTDACIGCGACANVCDEKAIMIERELGPIIKTKELSVDQESCVACEVCEENCPVEAIKLVDDEIILSEDKCVLCEVCSRKCPVGALKLERLPDEG